MIFNQSVFCYKVKEKWRFGCLLGTQNCILYENMVMKRGKENYAVIYENRS